MLLQLQNPERTGNSYHYLVLILYLAWKSKAFKLVADPRADKKFRTAKSICWVTNKYRDCREVEIITGEKSYK